MVLVPPHDLHAPIDRLTLDRAAAELQNTQRDQRVNTFEIPATRLGAIAAFTLAAAVHNGALFGRAFGPALGIWLVLALAYWSVSTLCLRRWYATQQRWNLARAFLRMDVLMAAGIVGVSGGAASYLFFIPYIRVADQSLNGWRWCRQLVVLSACAHVAALALSPSPDGPAVDWQVQAMRVAVCSMLGLYVALSARAAETVRERDRSTVREAHDLVSELKAGSRALEVARQRAEDAAETKSRFLATMSHELRTPMNGVIGMTELTLATELDTTQREYLSTVKDSAHGLLDILNEILDFSKIESGHLEINSQPFSLRSCIAEAFRVTAFKGHDKGLVLACNVDEDVPDSVVGDDLRLRQILVNLLGNAIKFTAQGHVRLWARRVRGGHCFELCVDDSGVGIPSDKLVDVFDAFTQGEQTTTRRFGGTGLGLAISRELSLEMGGTLDAESEVGVGSRFKLTLPLVQADTATTKNEQGPLSAEARRGPIVLVTACDVVKDSLTRLIEGWSAEVVTISSAKDALAAREATNRAFVAVVCDAAVDSAVRTEIDTSLQDSPPLPWLLLQRTTGHRDGGIPVERLTSLLMPIIGHELRSTLESATRIPSPTESARAAFGLGARERTKGRSAARSLSVLLVEDNPVNQRVARALLGSWGHRVTVAENGEIALQRLESGAFDVVLMDMQMPVMDGLEATRRVREREHAAGSTPIPIIAMTANAMKGDETRCREAGMTDYVPKPINAGELFAKLEVLGQATAQARG